jgi:hypothetical protein
MSSNLGYNGGTYQDIYHYLAARIYFLKPILRLDANLLLTGFGGAFANHFAVLTILTRPGPQQQPLSIDSASPANSFKIQGFVRFRGLGLRMVHKPPKNHPHILIVHLLAKYSRACP